MPYNDSEFLQLSGIQHFSFCRRQWALIHIEQQWSDNARTVGGEIFHERAHDSDIREKRGGLLTVRSLPVSSATLGVSGSCDVVEFRRSATGAPLKGEEGLWQPYPVEYKHGTSMENDADRLQLCVQAMCLEEMLCCPIPEGALFYEQTRRREKVELTAELRDKAAEMLKEMHEYYKRGYTPKVRTGKHCNACSLKELCMPVLCKSSSAAEYVKKHITEDEP